jgi:hypothetical protein
MMMMILLLSVTTTITSIAHLFTTYSIAYSANPSQSKQQPPSCSNPIARVIQVKTGYSDCDMFPVWYADSQGCFEYSTNPDFHQLFSFTAPVNGTATCTSPPTSAANIQIVTYASNTTCSGPVVASTVIPTDICLPVGIPSGNSSIFTKTGNVVIAQSYSDFGCSNPDVNVSLGPLNTCSIQDGSAVIFYAYAPNTLPPAPFTSTMGQVTATYA